MLALLWATLRSVSFRLVLGHEYYKEIKETELHYLHVDDVTGGPNQSAWGSAEFYLNENLNKSWLRTCWTVTVISNIIRHCRVYGEEFSESRNKSASSWNWILRGSRAVDDRGSSTPVGSSTSSGDLRWLIHPLCETSSIGIGRKSTFLWSISRGQTCQPDHQEDSEVVRIINCFHRMLVQSASK